MAVLTEAEIRDVVDRKYVVLRTNIGNYLQGEVVAGAAFGRRDHPEEAAHNVRRMLWGKHLREARPEEEGLEKVTLDEQGEQHPSYEARVSRLERECERLRQQNVSLHSECERLRAEARPREPGGNEQASLALLKQKEERLNEALRQVAEFRQERDDLKRDNERLMERLTQPSSGAGGAQPPAPQTLPPGASPQGAGTQQSPQPQRKPR
jgi:predicted RNase H-like nuclease (RuvC/YqgF family)